MRQLRLKILARQHRHQLQYFKFSLPGTSTIVLYSFESPQASLCPCANTFCVRRGLAQTCEKRKPKYTSCALKSTLPYKRLRQTQTPTVVATPQLLSSLQCQIKGTCSTPTPKCTSELLLFSPDATVTRNRSTRTKDGTQPRNNERWQLFHLP